MQSQYKAHIIFTVIHTNFSGDRFPVKDILDRPGSFETLSFKFVTHKFYNLGRILCELKCGINQLVQQQPNIRTKYLWFEEYFKILTNLNSIQYVCNLKVCDGVL